eukprot:3949476-Lingulodinium_polyedra.AAC.1
MAAWSWAWRASSWDLHASSVMYGQFPCTKCRHPVCIRWPRSRTPVRVPARHNLGLKSAELTDEDRGLGADLWHELGWRWLATARVELRNVPAPQAAEPLVLLLGEAVALRSSHRIAPGASTRCLVAPRGPIAQEDAWVGQAGVCRHEALEPAEVLGQEQRPTPRVALQDGDEREAQLGNAKGTDP